MNFTIDPERNKLFSLGNFYVYQKYNSINIGHANCPTNASLRCEWFADRIVCLACMAVCYDKDAIVLEDAREFIASTLIGE